LFVLAFSPAFPPLVPLASPTAVQNNI